MHEPPLLTYSDFLRARHGATLYAVPLNIGLGCPNRLDGSGGCAFCPGNGARSVIINGCADLEDQVRRGVDFGRGRYGATLFAAYLQAFSNTFASDSGFRTLCERVLSLHPFRTLHIGTRPDCLSDATLDWLRDVNTRLEVWIEPGIQTVHDRTLAAMNRGHDWAAGKDAIERIRQAGLRVAPHVIIGLPGEGRRDFRHTIRSLVACGIDGIKLHNLHVLRGTALAEQYARAPFPVPGEHDYADILADLLRIIPADIPIMRLTTDSLPEDLIAPAWSMGKEQFRVHLFELMRQRGIRQGDRAPDAAPPSPPEAAYAPIPTGDGSVTFWSTRFREHFHTPAGARAEARRKYISPARLEERLAASDVRLLDICFGLGYNSLMACEAAATTDRHALSVTALEMDRRVVSDAARHLRGEPSDRLDWPGVLHALLDTGAWSDGSLRVDIHWGDARHTLLAHEGPFDIVLLDAFSTQRNSELWTVDFFRHIRQRMAPDGVLLTYCAALPVRAGLEMAGFHVGETEPFGRTRGGTLASPDERHITLALSERERYLIGQTERGIPYRDPSGTLTNRDILRARQEEILCRKRNTHGPERPLPDGSVP